MFFFLLLRDFNAMALFLPALSSLRTPPALFQIHGLLSH